MIGWDRVFEISFSFLLRGTIPPIPTMIQRCDASIYSSMDVAYRACSHERGGIQ